MKLTRLVLVLVLALGASAARADVIERAGDHHGLGQLGLAYASTMAVVYILKPIVDRTRPDGDGQSFPSGHAASAFVGAAFLQRRYGWRFGVPAYALANLVFTHRRAPVSLAIEPNRAAILVSIAW